MKVREPALAVAFYYAMRDTVVAADLEQASRIAYGPDKRWAKVVTLKARLPPAASARKCLHALTLLDRSCTLACRRPMCVPLRQTPWIGQKCVSALLCGCLCMSR